MNHPIHPPSLDLLDDDALWEIVRSQLSAGDVTRLTWLLEENADNALAVSERAELEARSAEAHHFIQRKARAAALLQERGYVVPAGEDI
jgi:hypothetical protein